MASNSYMSHDIFSSCYHLINSIAVEVRTVFMQNASLYLMQSGNECSVMKQLVFLWTENTMSTFSTIC